jgi:hypothetical protein
MDERKKNDEMKILIELDGSYCVYPKGFGEIDAIDWRLAGS